MLTTRQILFIAALIGLAQPLVAEELPVPTWDDVQPVFELRCTRCHSTLGAAKGLQLDSYEAVIAGSEDGVVVIAGDVIGSEMLRRIRGESTPRMPFLSVPLPDDEADLITRWVAGGVLRGASER